MTTKESATGLGFETVDQKLKDRLRDDMETRAENESRKVTAKLLFAPKDWAPRPLAYRRAAALKYLDYVPVPREDGPENWRRTLDRL